MDDLKGKENGMETKEKSGMLQLVKFHKHRQGGMASTREGTS
jgi:hypothetical protein